MLSNVDKALPMFSRFKPAAPLEQWPGLTSVSRLSSAAAGFPCRGSPQRSPGLKSYWAVSWHILRRSRRARALPQSSYNISENSCSTMMLALLCNTTTRHRQNVTSRPCQSCPGR